MKAAFQLILWGVYANTSSGFCTLKTTPIICILDIFHVTVNFTRKASKEWEFCQRK